MTASIEIVERVETRLGALNVRIIGSGVTTVLWPSMFVDSHTWDDLVPLLGTGRRFVLVDGPGLGLSDPLTRLSTIDEAADAARDLLAGLKIFGPIDWVGNAFGGHVGYKLAARTGVLRSLVAISAPAEPIGAALRAQLTALAPVLRVAGPVGPLRNAIVSAMVTEESAKNEHVRQVITDGIGRPNRRSLTNALRSFILARTDVTDELAAIAVPCLFISSDDRGDWSAEEALRTAARTPDARAVTIPQARTLIALEQPARVAEHITRFWAELP